MRLPFDPGSRFGALSRWVPRAMWLLAGLWILFSTAVAAQGGRAMLWRFSHDERHRFTAMAMLTGTFRLRNSLSIVNGDEQIYNGAGYTNWGFGAPLLQMPFQALAHRMKAFSAGFFPDRAIFFFYLAILIPVLWAAFDRLLALGGPGKSERFTRDALSWAGTLFVLTYALFPLMSARFIVYEEALSYLVVFELFALSAYVFSLGSRSLVSVGAMGLAAGIGLLVRPTGLIYLGVWGMLIAIERRTKSAIAAFAAAASPFVVLWLYSNWVKTGSIASFGYQNSMPWFPFHTPMMRFDNIACATSLEYTWQVAAQLFEWFFITIRDDANISTDDRSPHVRACHFMYELRPPENHFEAFLGPGVLLFLAWVLLHHLVRRERRLAIYVAFAAFVFIFGNYVRGPGFVWRYTGDFWPLIVLIGVEYVRCLPSPARRLLGVPLALVLALCARVGFKKNIEPSWPTLQVLDDGGVANLTEDFRRTRYHTDGPLPSRVECGHVAPWPYHNGQGWNSACGVDTFTNVFLAVPKKANADYELRFRTEGFDAPSLRVYVNGRVYTAQKTGDTYVAAVRGLNYGALHTPNVMVAVEWTRDPDPKPGKMLAIELV